MAAGVLELLLDAAADPQLGRQARAADVSVVLDVLRGGNVHVDARGQLEPAGLVQKLLVTRGLARAALDVEEVDAGRKALYKIFVEAKLITAGDFDLCWHTVDVFQAPQDVIQPFIQTLHEKGVFPIEKALRLMCDKSRAAYLPLDHYDMDMELARGFPAEICRRWCVLPFDRMSKAILVATANPFNQQAAKELAAATTHRLLWYIASPNDLTSNLRKAFR